MTIANSTLDRIKLAQLFNTSVYIFFFFGSIKVNIICDYTLQELVTY